MAKLKDTTLSAMIPANVDGVAPGDDGSIALGAVRFNTAQTLSAEQQAQARSNIGVAASSDPPAMAGEASAGSSAAYARGDHVHPAETATSYTPGQPYFPVGFFPCSIYDHTDVWTWDSADANGVPNDPEMSTFSGPLTLRDTTYQSQAVVGLFSGGNLILAYFDRDTGGFLGVDEPAFTGFSRSEIGIAPPVLSSVSVRGVDVETKSDAEAHTSDTDIHVSAQEKQAWDGKLDARDLSYALGTEQTGSTIALANLTMNLAKPTASALVLTFPDETGGKARDFLLALYPDRSDAPAISFGSYITLVGNSGTLLTPTPQKWNIYSFTEQIRRNKFLVTRRVVETLVEHEPASADQLLEAMAASGMDVSSIATPGDVSAALGLPDGTTMEACVDAVVHG